MPYLKGWKYPDNGEPYPTDRVFFLHSYGLAKIGSNGKLTLRSLFTVDDRWGAWGFDPGGNGERVFPWRDLNEDDLFGVTLTAPSDPRPESPTDPRS